LEIAGFNASREQMGCKYEGHKKRWSGSLVKGRVGDSSKGTSGSQKPSGECVRAQCCNYQDIRPNGYGNGN
jgi:hypothetical protein